MRHILGLVVLVAVIGQATGGHAASCVSSSDCDDGNPCTDDLCDPVLGCLHASNGAQCSDGNACTTGDVCSGGTCVGGGPAAGCTPCQAAAIIPAQGGVFAGTTGGTSTLAGSCGSSGSSPERVYLWTPALSGVATISTCGSGTLYDTVVYLRRGGCGGTEVACNDDTAGCGTGEPNDHHGSKIAPNVVAGQTYAIVVDGYGGAQGNYVLTVVPPSVCGNDVREGSEQCDGADASGCATGQCTTACTCVQPQGGLPDLVPLISDVSLDWKAIVASGDVAEGCAEQTTGVDLLRFSVLSENLGTADLVLGDPMCPSPCTDYPLAVCGNPEFICSPAAGHNHAHYTDYARYELLDGSNQAVVVGHKQGFCLGDSNCAAPKYTCTNQGITAGCSDLYSTGLGCQYLDITGVPPGNYTLRVRMDPFGRIAELDETNNDATLPVVIPVPPTTTTTTTTLPGGACLSPTVVPAVGGTFAGTTSGASTLSGCAAATDGAPEAVFQWTPAASGTASVDTCGAGTHFDTVVYVWNGSCGAGTQVACNDDTSGCGTGDGCSSADHHGSRAPFAVTAGQTYYVVVDGYAGSCGGSSGTFTLHITAPGATTTSTTGTTTTTSSTTTTTTTPSTTTPTTTSTTTTSSTSTTTTSTTSTTVTSTTSTTTTSTTSTTLGGACGAVTVIGAAGGTFSGATSGASTLAGTCGATATAPERVFQWTPNRSGVATIATCDTHTNFDTVVYVRQGSCTTGTEIACNNDDCGVASRVKPPVTAGVTYFIVVDGNAGAKGKFKLKVTPAP